MTVERERVGNVLSLQRRSVDIDPLTEYSLIGVYSFGKGIFHREPRRGSELGNYRFFSVAPGDLVLSNIQAWEGAIAYADEHDAGTIGTHRFLTYVPKDERIDTAWAKWFFLSEPGMELIRRAAPGTTIRNRTLAIDRFEALEIPLPPIDEQRQQASKLNAVSRSAHDASAALSRLTASNIVAALPAFIDSVFERAAAAWKPVRELADFVSDTVHPGDDPSPAESFVGLQHIESHTGRCTGRDALGPMQGRKFRFRPGDILYGYLRPYLNKIWLADRHGLCSVDQYVLRPREGTNAELFAYALRGRRVLDRSIELTHNLQLPRLRSGLLAAIEVPHINGHRAIDTVGRLDSVRDMVVEVATLRARQAELVEALIPSGMNAVFGGLK